jgi:hypothetical protein
MDASVTFGGGCADWLQPTTGIAIYNTAGNGELLIVTRPAVGGGVFAFVGNR